MPACNKAKCKEKIKIGDLNKKITLQNRNITPPIFGSPDFDETFSNDVEVWARIITKEGKTFFDGINTDINITHEITIRYDATVTAETWILFESRRIDILRVVDINEDHQFMKLICNERGLSANRAAMA